MRNLSCILVIYIISNVLLGHLIYVARGRAHYHKRRGLSDPPPPLPVTADPPQVPSDPYPNPNPDPESGCVFDVTTFGAVGDGSCDDTEAFRAAWKAACAVESGVVLAPEGGVFKITSTIFSGPCKPGLVFQLEGVLMAPDGPEEWPEKDSKSQWLVFYRLDSMTFAGKGTVEGNGQKWWDLPCKPHRGPDGSTSSGPCVSPTMIRFFMSKNVAVKGLRIQNSPQFHMKFDGCEGVVIDDIQISSPKLSPNTDGIHLGNTRSVSIYNSLVSNGDDCISIGTGCSDVDIQGVTCGPSHGIRCMLGRSTWIITKEKRDQHAFEDQEPQSVDSAQQSTDSTSQSVDNELKLGGKKEERRSMAIVREPEILLNDAGQRVDADGNRLDAAGNIIPTEVTNGRGERRMLIDEPRPDQFFSNRSAIVLPPIHGINFLLNRSTTDMVKDQQYYGLRHENPMEHIEAFEETVRNIMVDGVMHEWLCCKLFHYSLEDGALSWLKQLEPGSLKTWKEVKNKFLNHFFDEEKSGEMRRKITTYQQTNFETFNDTWKRYRRYLVDCPHHGFSNSRVVIIFFRGLIWEHKNALDVASGGDFMEKYPDDALNFIEKYANSCSANHLVKENANGVEIYEAKATSKIEDMLRQLLRKKNKTPHFFEQVKPMENLSYFGGVGYHEPMQQYENTYSGFDEDYTTPSWTQGAHPQDDSKFESMMQQMLDVQRTSNGYFYMTIDSMYDALNKKMEAVNTYMRQLDTQVACKAEAVKGQDGIFPSEIDPNSKAYDEEINIEENSLSRGISFGDEFLVLE